MIRVLGQHLLGEVRSLCSQKVDSILQRNGLTSFTWDAPVPSSSIGLEPVPSSSIGLEPVPSSSIAESSSSNKYPTFKIVGDNIDKTIKPRYMRSDHQSKLLHYFHHYAVQDRVNMFTLSDIPPCPPKVTKSLPESILPSQADNQVLSENFAIHISHILASHMI